MGWILTVDVGAGTMDVLCMDVQRGEHFKAVVRSPVAALAREVETAPGKLLILGKEMGGGAVSQAVKTMLSYHRVHDWFSGSAQESTTGWVTPSFRAAA